MLSASVTASRIGVNVHIQNISGQMTGEEWPLTFSKHPACQH
jgi:hypothetical protein